MPHFAPDADRLAVERTLRRPRRPLLRIAVPALIGLALVTGWGLWMRSGEMRAPERVTEAVTRGDIVSIVVATGTIQPRGQVDISSELSGTLASVDADFNDRVEAGQILARLDDTTLKARMANAEASVTGARARLAQAAATLEETRTNLETEQDLDSRGVSSRNALVARRADFRRAEAALDLARADLTVAEADRDLRRSDLGKAMIRAPIAGMVLDRSAEPGQTVASSLSAPTLFVIAEDLAEMELQVDIDEADIGRVNLGNRANFSVEAYDGKSFSGEVIQLRYAPEKSDGIVTYKGILTVDNADLLLRPGMTATARIRVDEAKDVLRVPNAALRFVPESPPPTGASSSTPAGTGRGNAGLLGVLMPRRPASTAPARKPAGAPATLWTLTGSGPLEVEVKTGRTDGHFTEILEGELDAGDLVITDERPIPE